MKFISNSTQAELLKNVPDFTSWGKALRWLQQGQQVVGELTLSEIAEAQISSLDWHEVGIPLTDNSPFGLYASEIWRKFVLATFLADTISYLKPADQVNFERLLFVMHAFPQGFRIWWMKCAEHGWWPVGYTGWYPMSEAMYELFEKNPEKLTSRMVAPDLSLRGEKPFLYLFNYSVAPALKKSELTNSLLKQYAQDVNIQKAGGLACVTVSEEGRGVAKRFGMSCSGYLNFDGDQEGVYTRRF